MDILEKIILSLAHHAELQHLFFVVFAVVEVDVEDLLELRGLPFEDGATSCFQGRWENGPGSSRAITTLHLTLYHSRRRWISLLLLLLLLLFHVLVVRPPPPR